MWFWQVYYLQPNNSGDISVFRGTCVVCYYRKPLCFWTCSRAFHQLILQHHLSWRGKEREELRSEQNLFERQENRTQVIGERNFCTYGWFFTPLPIYKWTLVSVTCYLKFVPWIQRCVYSFEKMARDVFEADDSVLNLVLDACKVCWSLILWIAISEEN